MTQTLTLTIPAAVGGVNGVLLLPASYKVFSCISTNGTYTALTSQAAAPVIVDQAGRGFGSANGITYGTLILANATAGIVTTTIYVGDVALPQSFVANTLTVTAAKDAPTYPKCTGSLNLAGGASSAAYTGVDNGHQRKHFIISNLDNAATFDVTDGNNTGVQCPPLGSRIIATSGSLKVKNTSGGAANYEVMEIFYTV